MLCSLFSFCCQVCGLLVWTLLGGTEYLRVPALGWVMCVSVVCWVLTVCLLLLHLTTAHTKIPHVPWSTLVSGLSFNNKANNVAKTSKNVFRVQCLYPDSCISLLHVKLRFKSHYLSQGLCFNSSATILYMTAAVINATSVPQAIRGRYYYFSWVASTVRGREVSFPLEILISLE